MAGATHRRRSVTQDGDGLLKQRCAVIVPAFNEAKVIERMLDALRAQTVRPAHIFVVDNASSDTTAAIVRRYAAVHPELAITLLSELQKGTGAACDTGFRAALNAGFELLARTDADCVPEKRWLEAMLQTGAKYPAVQLIAGRLIPLHDEWYRRGDELLLSTGLGIIQSGLRLYRRDKAYKHIAIGSNLMIRAGAYEPTGGFPRVAIDQKDEDIELSIRVARQFGCDAIGYERDAVVAVSMRRPRTQGAWRTLARHIVPQYRKRQKTHDVR